MVGFSCTLYGEAFCVSRDYDTARANLKVKTVVQWKAVWIHFVVMWEKNIGPANGLTRNTSYFDKLYPFDLV